MMCFTITLLSLLALQKCNYAPWALNLDKGRFSSPPFKQPLTSVEFKRRLDTFMEKGVTEDN